MTLFLIFFLLECLDGTYGENCSNECGINCEVVCEKIDGTCSSCKPGYEGSMCTKGRYISWKMAGVLCIVDSTNLQTKFKKRSFTD